MPIEPTERERAAVATDPRLDRVDKHMHNGHHDRSQNSAASVGPVSPKNQTSAVARRTPALHESLRRIGRERLGVYRGLFAKRLMQWPLRALLRRLTRPVRRQADLVVFGSVRNRFADNSAYLFL